jgi:hypothetical protein
MPQTSAKVAQRRKARKKDTIALDTVLEKPRRGRPLNIKPSWVRGRGDNYRYIFGLIWDHVWPRLSTAKTRQDVVESFSGSEVGGYATDLVIAADLILQVLRDPKFPKRKREAQINFLSDSIAGYGRVTPRTSRDICERERARIKKVYRILRYEFYIECSCGYNGHSLNHACPHCEAAIEFVPDSSFFLDQMTDT